ncbi:MAG: SH3 domain-containing protein [Clostridioides sp.]|nr:SH3 domain-containing protein [Clostridioides sp.]
MKKVATAIGVGAIAITVNSLNVSAAESGMVTASALNIRTSPSTQAAKAGLAYKGQTVQILEKSNGWYRVKVSNSLTGWASGQYISLGGSSDNSNSSSSSGSNSSSGGSTSVSGNGRVSVSSKLNVRNGAGTNFSVVGKASNGEIVQLLESQGGWYKVKLSNGIVGWVSGQYIVKTSESAGSNSGNSGSGSSNSNSSNQNSSGDTAVQGKRGKIINTTSLNVRSGAGTSYSVVGHLNGGDVVSLLESKSGWYKMKTLNGTTGWIGGSYVAETSDSLKDNSSSGSGNNSNDSSSNNSSSNNSDSSNSNSGSGSTSKSGVSVVNYAYTLIGIPYQWGATGPNSFDCSGFTQYVYRNSVGKSLPRVSRDQASMGTYVQMGSYAQGDLVYFDTTGDKQTNHIGIYVGNGKFIHCSGTQANPNKVKVDSLDSSYWSKALLGARRVL